MMVIYRERGPYKDMRNICIVGVIFRDGDCDKREREIDVERISDT